MALRRAVTAFASPRARAASLASTRGRDARRGGRVDRRWAASGTTTDDDANDDDDDDDHARRMRRAIELARVAGDAGEVPIGAVLVDEETGEVVAEAANACEGDGDPTAHAEMRVIRLGAEKLGGWRHLKRTRMYVTLEPCAMCAGAILQSRVGGVTYGAKNTLLGADGSWVSMMRREFVGEDGGPVRPHAFTPELDVRGGVLAEETGTLMKEFFKRRRTLGSWSPKSEDENGDVESA